MDSFECKCKCNCKNNKKKQENIKENIKDIEIKKEKGLNLCDYPVERLIYYLHR